MKYVIFITLLVSTLAIEAQDTLNILQYNLMYYGLNDVGCNSTNNNIDTKNNYLKDIIDYVNPDIFTVNEIYADANAQDYLLNNVFLENNHTGFKRAEVHGSYLTQQVFYNAQKVELKSVNYIDGYPRDAHVYKFFYRAKENENGDTVFFNCIVVHLKAGGTSSDEQNRSNLTQNIMNYIARYSAENFMLMGDFNVYSSSETAFQNLVAPSNSDLKFNDPVNQIGEWHNNENYTKVHTQSTQFYGTDCASGGGLDDRFDFILINNKLADINNSIHYLTDSYQAVGNDGNHFNDGIDYQGNNSVPANVLRALANNSDHLPVNAKFIINQTGMPTSIKTPEFAKLQITNPANQNLLFTIFSDKFINQNLSIEIYSLSGKKFKQTNLQTYSKQIQYSIPITELPNGMYILSIRNTKGNTINQKFIKQWH